VRISLTFDLGKRPPLLNNCLFGIILGDPYHWKPTSSTPIIGKTITGHVMIWL
jgi:hypothetical protein